MKEEKIRVLALLPTEYAKMLQSITHWKPCSNLSVA